ncbi:transposase [Bremerella cremea]|uniref:Transposase n=1 Tax=Bremerella cremea TaxID=1031537 RepID=A0A368KST7_9BACT|nr:transposase [Bremerella cremea]RCS52696.1 transposase [Bremerella cremea]
MPNYRRARVPGGMYFFTLVTENRAPIFRDSTYVRLLGKLLREAKQRWPFRVEAMVLLPDHLHAVWGLPRGDDRYSLRWGWIKKEFSREYLRLGGKQQATSRSRRRNRRFGVWQRRFWEHTVQDEDEYRAYLDYIHWNPAKHGHALAPGEWPHSTFNRWVEAGLYEPDWGRLPPDEQRWQKLPIGE